MDHLKKRKRSPPRGPMDTPPLTPPQDDEAEHSAWMESVALMFSQDPDPFPPNWPHLMPCISPSLMVLIIFLMYLGPHRAHTANIKKDVYIGKDNGFMTFYYNSSSTKVATYIFDYCSIVECPQNLAWQCFTYRQAIYICVTDSYWGNKCDSWGSVGWDTGYLNDKSTIPTGWGYNPAVANLRRSSDGRSLLNRLTLIRGKACSNPGSNPGSSIQLVLTIYHPSPDDSGLYVLGSWAKGGTGGEKRGRFKLQDTAKLRSHENPLTPIIRPSYLKDTRTLQDPTYEDSLAIETGFSDTNLWLEWVKFNALQQNRSNCYVCGAARPHLGTVPFPLPEDIEECFLRSYLNDSSDSAPVSTTTSPTYSPTALYDPTLCQDLKLKFPRLRTLPQPGERIHAYPGNYTCYQSFAQGRNLTSLPDEYCHHTSPVNASSLLQDQVYFLGDLYWLCGDMRLRSRLPSKWNGRCALVAAIMGFHIIPDTGHSDPSTTSPPFTIPLLRHKRETVTAPGSLDPHVYIDAIGVPRGVPNEFKARDQVAAGFESLIPIITINKNVDWINYLYYNQQRFVNYTRDALQGLAEQLQSTSIMTFQNRMALDMILAEKGGVCKMIEGTGTCCTYIPDNLGPNGKVTRAIKKLTELSEEMKRNSGIDNPWDQYFGWFKGWRQALTQLAIALCLILLCIAIVVYCLIPCLSRALKSSNPTSHLFSATPPVKENIYATTTPSEYADYVALRRKLYFRDPGPL
uniref:Envelope protein n=1 Tax=Leptobrachium leishanense TaxID=445787 RepID=A0A8C5N1U0_9ANUR